MRTLSPSDAPQATPRQVDALTEALRNRYVVECEVARGGMATVYLARDLRHGRPVALKVMRADLATCLGPDRFQREIRLVARLQHPHILTVLDSGEAAGQPWFTMPFVQGESLRDRLRRQRKLPVEEALRITREAAEALGYAHRHGIVHRDVKPENLLLMEDGSTLLADFGVALPVADSKEDHFTETGLSIGTPAYIAPEQATGRETVDGRADQYALAATCYEMLTGATPFTGPTAAAIVAQRFTKPVPSVRLARPEVPVPIDKALLSALELEPEDRFSTMDEFVGALAGDPVSVVDTTSTESPTVTIPAHRSRPLVSAAAWVVPLLALLALGAQYWPAGSEARSTIPPASAMSPLQYQKQLRLQAARVLQLGRAMDAASAAYEVGYESPYQFSREYRSSVKSVSENALMQSSAFLWPDCIPCSQNASFMPWVTLLPGRLAPKNGPPARSW